VALELHDRSLPQVFSGGLSVDNLSWWFWVKAGAGFTLGASTIGFVFAVLAWLTFGAIGATLLTFLGLAR
jgi:hypothetical protein